MPSVTDASRPAVLWQGFSLRWQYNHRANRIGSYVEHAVSPDGSHEIDAVHTAASGTGPDRAEFVDPFTVLQARDARFRAGACEVALVTTEEQLTSFRLLNQVELEPTLAGKDTYTVVLNGFDLIAEGDAKKLMTLALGVSEPELDEGRTLSVVDEGVPSPADRVRYVLRVRYSIVAGNDDDVRIAPAEPVAHSYTWDRRTELPSDLAGRAPIDVPPVAGTPGYDGFAFAFKEIITTLYRRDIESRPFWRQDIAMHLLEWNMRIWDVKQLEGDRFACSLDLFFKNWGKGMRCKRLPFSLFAYRDAGEAQFGAQLVLLQFKDADLEQKGVHDGSIDWPGGNREAMDDPAAIRSRRIYTA